MSIFEKGSIGDWACAENRALALNVVNTVVKSPELAKDPGFKQAVQNAALDLYYTILTDGGAPQEDVNYMVTRIAQRLKEKPRKETIIFARLMHDVSSARKNGKGKLS